MRRLLVTALLLAPLAAPAPAGAAGCTVVAVPPWQYGSSTRGDGAMTCDGAPRGAMSVEVCVSAFAFFAGWLTLGCEQVDATGSVTAVTGAVLVCPHPDFPLMRTEVTGTTDRGETAFDASVLTTATCFSPDASD